MNRAAAAVGGPQDSFGSIMRARWSSWRTGPDRSRCKRTELERPRDPGERADASVQCTRLGAYLCTAAEQRQGPVLFNLKVQRKERKDLASFHIADGGEIRHVMCVGARSGLNPGPLDTEPSALTNCASHGCPVVAAYVPCEADVERHAKHSLN